MDVLDFCNHRLTCSMNPEIALTCTCGHYNQAFFAVIYSLGYRTLTMYTWEEYSTL